MSQKVCAIVGFGTGVSMGVARAFGKEGYNLALVARNPAKLAENARSLNVEGVIVKSFPADAGDEASVIQAFTNIRTELGDPEVLIYNAAGFAPGKPTSLTAQAIVADFQVNVAGALVAGTILLTGGGLALYPAAEVASLSIGKAGIRSLAFTLAQELQESGIHVGTVTICGTVQPGTHFDPDAIAQSYLALHLQLPTAFETEVIYK
jgi:short-subunit dehydrogenase